jgi:hypothetical protein
MVAMEVMVASVPMEVTAATAAPVVRDRRSSALAVTVVLAAMVARVRMELTAASALTGPMVVMAV